MSYDPVPAPSRPAGVHLAISLIGLTLAAYLGSEILNSAQHRKALNWQLTNGEKQIQAAKENEKQLADLTKQQDTVVKQAGEVQAQYQKLLDDLLKLSEDDADAKQVVEKWKIQRSANQSATAAPAADAAPAKQP
jgi:seryl-tRNA synthetase